MTLLITLFASLFSTIIWYTSRKARELKISILVFSFWGATIMWFVDAVFEYIELKAEYFQPSIGEMINDTFLGFSVVALGLLIWIVVLLISDPKNVFRADK